MTSRRTPVRPKLYGSGKLTPKIKKDPSQTKAIWIGKFESQPLTSRRTPVRPKLYELGKLTHDIKKDHSQTNGKWR